jgi:hypothetical protein
MTWTSTERTISVKPKRPAKSKAVQPVKARSGKPSRVVAGGREATFREVVGMIQAARGRALQAVDTERLLAEQADREGK